MFQIIDEDSPELFETLSPLRQEKLLCWIRENLVPIKRFNRRDISYGLLRLISFEDGTNPLFTNGEFKGAMLEAGFNVKDKSQRGWSFNISERSPCFGRRQ